MGELDKDVLKTLGLLDFRLLDLELGRLLGLKLGLRMSRLLVLVWMSVVDVNRSGCGDGCGDGCG